METFLFSFFFGLVPSKTKPVLNSSKTFERQLLSLFLFSCIVQMAHTVLLGGRRGKYVLLAKKKKKKKHRQGEKIYQTPLFITKKWRWGNKKKVENVRSMNFKLDKELHFSPIS